MTTLLRQEDFDRTMIDMWPELVEQLIQKNIIPEDTKADDVEEIDVQVTGARMFDE